MLLTLHMRLHLLVPWLYILSILVPWNHTALARKLIVIILYSSLRKVTRALFTAVFRASRFVGVLIAVIALVMVLRVGGSIIVLFNLLYFLDLVHSVELVEVAVPVVYLKLIVLLVVVIRYTIILPMMLYFGMIWLLCYSLIVFLLNHLIIY